MKTTINLQDILYLKRRETQTRYAYDLHFEDGTKRTLRCGRSRQYYLQMGEERMHVWFNEYVFDDFDVIPVGYNSAGNCIEMSHRYEQRPTADRIGANAPFIRIS